MAARPGRIDSEVGLMNEPRFFLLASTVNNYFLLYEYEYCIHTVFGIWWSIFCDWYLVVGGRCLVFGI